MCFNILQTINLETTHFKQIMGNINLSSFGASIMRLFPILLIILLALKYFDVYAKALNVFGISQSYDENSEDFKSAKVDGRAMVLEELAKEGQSNYKN